MAIKKRKNLKGRGRRLCSLRNRPWAVPDYNLDLTLPAELKLLNKQPTGTGLSGPFAAYEGRCGSWWTARHDSTTADRVTNWR